jgi:propanol-preferring alcohol dehydrogenase
MKAWQFTGTHRPLGDVPEPTAGPDEVLIDIKAAGLCHSDVSILEVDDFPCPPGRTCR